MPSFFRPAPVKKALLLFLFLASALLPSLGSQEGGEKTPLPRGYRGMELGMSLAEVRAQLLNDPWFNYRGDPELSMRESPNSSFIDAGGSLFISRGLFQFEAIEAIKRNPTSASLESPVLPDIQYQLSAIVLELNPRTVDWYTIYTTLEERYGEPQELNPQRAWWQNAQVRLALEKPLTVKYLGQNIFSPEPGRPDSPIAARATARRDFLKEF